MRWGPTTGQCQAQGAMLWIIVRPSCQVPEGEQKGSLFIFFLFVACFLMFKEKPRGPERLPPAGAAGPKQGAGHLPACSSCSTAVYAGISSLLWVCLHDTLPTKHVRMMHGGRMT